ncbi:MAG: GntR family transcriptional regulator [Candidatus Izemoplasmatales bacterium]
MKNITISSNTQTPIYKQLYDQISLQILSGNLESESLLPSIRNIAKELRVSIITIKKTWDMLEQNGYIYTIAGKGSYVAKHTKVSISEKKHDILKTSLSTEISLAKSLGYTKEEIISLIDEIFAK